jgi:predicted small integral membrane protein
MSGGLALLTALIAHANVHDPGANLKFLDHVLSMESRRSSLLALA